MAQLEFFVVCESVSVDKLSNQVSILGVIEDLTCESFPGGLQKCVAFSQWRKSPGDEEIDWQATIKVILPNGGETEVPVNFRFGSSQKHRITQVLYGLALPCEGELKFQLFLNGSHIADHLAFVKKGELLGTHVVEFR